MVSRGEVRGRLTHHEYGGDSSASTPRHRIRSASQRSQSSHYKSPSSPVVPVPSQPPTNTHGAAQDQEPPNWRIVLDELAMLRSEVAKVQAATYTTSTAAQQQVNFQAGPSGIAASPATYSGFNDSSGEDGEIKELPNPGSVLLQNAKELGPPESLVEDIDDQVAGMVNFFV